MNIRLKILINSLLLAGGLATAMPGVAGTTTRVSVASDGGQGNRFNNRIISGSPSVSVFGSVAFDSVATNQSVKATRELVVSEEEWWDNVLEPCLVSPQLVA